MIEIKNKQDCCGCGACMQRCPKSCITMMEDEEGFLYPEVNKIECIDCGLCELVCPVIHQEKGRKPLEVYAAKNQDDTIRLASSSGGLFTAVAECILDEGGVVFGARFDSEWSVVHSYTETKEGLAAFRRSKYVQSRIGESYKDAECLLKMGRKVLFSGTPCQIAGLKRFLRKEYENLLTVDFICHGVPSPGVWREYLKEEIARQCGEKIQFCSCSIPERDARIESISFRDKQLGWKKFSFALTISTTNGSGEKNSVLLSEPLNKNIFLRGFLADLYLRPSCHACPAKRLKSGSDITIGDFWGIQRVMPQIDDNKGMSVVLLNSVKAQEYIRDMRLDKWPIMYETVVRYNPSVIYSVTQTKKRDRFFNNKDKSFTKIVQELSKPSFLRRVKRKIGHMLRS